LLQAKNVKWRHFNLDHTVGCRFDLGREPQRHSPSLMSLLIASNAAAADDDHHSCNKRL